MNLSLDKLKIRLNQPLPAHRSHQRMMKHRVPISKLDKVKLGARKSAVLIMLYEQNSQWHFVLTKRTEYDGVHSGQISLPGGKSEKYDSTLESTALRETEEEIGINRDEIEILGSLSELYIPPSNFIVKPFIGFISDKPIFIPEEKEVDLILELPLSFITQRKNIKPITVEAKNSKLTVNAFLFKHHVIWGATSMILAEFADIINELT